jgi:hypothetical protein
MHFLKCLLVILYILYSKCLVIFFKTFHNLFNTKYSVSSFHQLLIFLVWTLKILFYLPIRLICHRKLKFIFQKQSLIKWLACMVSVLLSQVRALPSASPARMGLPVYFCFPVGYNRRLKSQYMI